MEYKKYEDNLTYSYVFGAFGTIELLNNKVEQCKAVIIDPSFKNNEAFQKIYDKCRSNNIELIIDLALINKIRDKKNIFVIGVFHKYESTLTKEPHIMLYNIDDVGLIGTIIRSMLGFNHKQLALINCNVDIFDTHLIRSTMGAYFSVNIKKYNSVESYMKDYPNKKIFLISKDGNEIPTISKVKNYSIMLSEKKCESFSYTKIKLQEDISIDTALNIILFNLYK